MRFLRRLQHRFRVRTTFRLALALLVLCPLSPALAQEIGLLAGYNVEHSFDEESYSWDLEYLHALGEHGAISIAWLNEGHFENNHRDGQTVQFWLRGRAFDPRLVFSAGIGPYFYYNTARASEGASYSDDHGWGGVLSASAKWYGRHRWFYELRVQRVAVNGGFHTTALLGGIGYQLQAPSSPGPVTKPRNVAEKTTGRELTVYAGQTIVNSFESESGLARAIEYRQGISPHVDWSVAWLHEGDAQQVRRNGIVAQLWLVRDFLQKRVALSAGGGMYIAVDKYRTNQEGEEDDETIAGMVAFSASYRFSQRWLTRVSWNRVVTVYNRDTDVILLGLGYRF
ncbi:MAG: hypothetical protein PVI98_04215 [Burkholderiales bacterium]|jgi:hypothetical protein